MILRSEYLAAVSKIRHLEEDLECKSVELSALDQRCCKITSQLKNSQAELATLRAIAEDTVSKADLAAEKARADSKVEEAAKLSQRLMALETENFSLQTEMQVFMDKLKAFLT